MFPFKLRCNFGIHLIILLVNKDPLTKIIKKLSVDNDYEFNFIYER